MLIFVLIIIAFRRDVIPARVEAVGFDYESVCMVMGSLEGYRIPEAEKERFGKVREAAGKPDWDALREIL